MTTTAAVLTLASLPNLPTTPNEGEPLTTTQPSYEQLMAELEAVKAALAAKSPAPKMTLEEAMKVVASYEGKRGRRPAPFHAAMKIVGKVRAKAAKEAAEIARTAKAAVLKNTRKAAKAVARAQKAADAAAAAELKVQKAQKIATKLNLKMIELTNKATELTATETPVESPTEVTPAV